jgi:predicted nucleic acid-binding protein
MFVRLPAMNFMNDKAFVDTSILVYAHDMLSGIKHERARSLVDILWSTECGVLSTQVLQELCVYLRRKSVKKFPVEEIQGIVTDFKDWQIVVNTPDSIIEALSIEARYQISFWDALIIQAAEISGASIVYTEDLSDGQMYGSVRVVNPLTEAASL